jgi:hypothetical protein
MEWCSLHYLDGHARAQDVANNALDARHARERIHEPQGQ